MKGKTILKNSRRSSYAAIRRYKVNIIIQDLLSRIVGDNNVEKIKKIVIKIIKVK